nr:MAG TPA: hypothetical protein [Caudoviricetes sp.]
MVFFFMLYVENKEDIIYIYIYQMVIAPKI